MRRCRHDFLYFATKYVWIENKANEDGTGYSRFVPLAHQEQVIHSLLNDRRLLVLKSRQLGFTTTVMMYLLWKACFYPGFSALVLSHRDDYAKANLNRMKIMYYYLPPWMKELLPAPNAASNNFKLTFADGRETVVSSLPATEKVGASLTLDFCYLDEYALMRYADEAYETLGPTLDAAMANTANKGCVLAIGSTARGSSNAFARMWNTDMNMKHLFFPWNCSPYYTQSDYDREKQEWINRGEPWRIHQERPSTPEEAFRKSGAAFFEDLPDIEDCEAFPGDQRGEIIEDADGNVSFAYDPYGRVHIADMPDDNCWYILAVDPAHGKERDSTVAIVYYFDYEGNPSIAAYWASNSVEPEYAADYIEFLGRFYHGTEKAALIVAETTGGHADLFIYKWKDSRYPNLYRYTQPARRGKRAQQRFGISTEGRGGKRAGILNRFKAKLPEMVNIYPELRFEMGTFVRRKGGEEIAADDGAHDDHVMAAAIGCWVLYEKGQPPVGVGPAIEAADRPILTVDLKTQWEARHKPNLERKDRQEERWMRRLDRPVRTRRSRR